MALATSTAVPAAAAAVGYNTQTFGPAVTLGEGWQRWSDAVNVQQNSNGTVTITGGGNGYNAQIITAAPNGSGGLTGEAFGGGGYFEASLSFTGSPVMNNGWPSFWANDIENQIQQQTGNGASQWQGQASGYVNSIEADFMEYMTGPGSYGIALHNWYGQQSAIQAVNTEGSGSPVSIPQGTDTSQPHDYGFLWVPATASTKGYAKWYFDHVQVGNTITWNQYNPATPPSPVDGSSAYSVMDARHLYMILGSGPSNPMTVYSVKAWQKSNAANIGTLQTPITNPSGGTTAPAAVTTGSGSDTLVLNMSEDAYNGDAQFTVSVDGKQLGGTFTTTALHTAGASQSFTFKGDWAPGAHSVAVNFLNDVVRRNRRHRLQPLCRQHQLQRRKYQPERDTVEHRTRELHRD